MNLQKMFDDIWNGLKSQNFNRSVTAVGGCMYRHDGMKCAAGHIIPDNLYDSEMEGISFFIGVWFGKVSAKAQMKLKNHLKEKYEIADDDWQEFVNNVNVLQGVHDNSYFPQVMREKLEEFAFVRQLDIPK